LIDADSVPMTLGGAGPGPSERRGSRGPVLQLLGASLEALLERSDMNTPVGAQYSVVCADQARCTAFWIIMFRILHRFLTSLACLGVRSGRSKDLEIIVLRHQLCVLQRQSTRPQRHCCVEGSGAVVACMGDSSTTCRHPFVRWLPVPARCDPAGGAVVSALRAVVPRRRRTPRRTRHRSRPRHHLPVGTTLHPATHRRRQTLPARGR